MSRVGPQRHREIYCYRRPKRDVRHQNYITVPMLDMKLSQRSIIPMMCHLACDAYNLGEIRRRFRKTNKYTSVINTTFMLYTTVYMTGRHVST